ncbi:threonine ammonia-lyase [Pontiella agarivorans]|uniref:Threonine ammonia-lyase n=1 Tax=Pontiella agarivorans TaxID=3038953 RepID=A0ABU5MV90_9BACT|nr:threonine ammonia-lyase [Pontiella agarivorans]MDZ8118133.1 threonine ammonia-lyase [Pontiella agarivorans]
MLTIDRIKDAANTLENVVLHTELIHSPVFSEESGNQVYLKPENLQLTGAFKLRGAYFKMANLNDAEKACGVISSSAGNHAQGVALAAQKLGVKATIVMPKNTPLIKIEATRRYGASVVLAGDFYDEAYAEARRLEKEKGHVFIHPFDDEEVMAGQGTIGLEILQDLEHVDAILVPIGGGGLIAGIATAVKALRPEVKVIGVEPEGACAMKKSLEAGRIVPMKKVDTIADGVAVKNPGVKTFEIIRDLVDDIITVPDTGLMESFLLLLERHKLVAENSGVLALAALHELGSKGWNVVPVVSGGNIDVVTMSAMIDNGLVRRGRICCFSVNLPDEPGQLLAVSNILSDENANIIKLDHNQFKSLDRLKEVQLEVTVETNGHAHVGSILGALEQHGYQVDRIY